MFVIAVSRFFFIFSLCCRNPRTIKKQWFYGSKTMIFEDSYCQQPMILKNISEINARKSYAKIMKPEKCTTEAGKVFMK